MFLTSLPTASPTGSTNTTPTASRSIIQDYETILQDLENRIAANKAEASKARQGQPGDTANPSTSPSAGHVSWPDYDAVLQELDTSIHTSTGLPERMCLAEVFLTRLAVITRFARATYYSRKDNSLRALEQYDEARSDNAAHANALANFERISAGYGIDLLPFLDKYLEDLKLVRIAKETVAIELCEEQLAECERGVEVRDLTALENIGTALLDLRKRRTKQLRTLLSLVGEDVSHNLIMARLNADGVMDRKPDGRQGLKEERRRKIRELFVKIAVAIFAGLTLLAPMLIMILHPGLITVLLTTSVFVTVIAVILAFALPTAEAKDIVGATAAYAAVLVVFVGTGGDYTGAKTAETSGWNVTTFGNTTTIANFGQSAANSPSAMSNGTIAGMVVGVIAGTLLLMTLIWLLWLVHGVAHPDRIPVPLPGAKGFREEMLQLQREKYGSAG